MYCAFLPKLFYSTIPVDDISCRVILEIIEVDESDNDGWDQEQRVVASARNPTKVGEF